MCPRALGPRFICFVLLMAFAPLHSVTGQIIVDNSDPEFTLTQGEWMTGSYGQPYGSDYNWAHTTDGGGITAEAEWRPDLPASGTYDVAVWYVSGGNRADNATFTVHHSGGSTPFVVNQQESGETWVELGSFPFAAGTTGSVSLHNDAHEHVVIADAVRFTYDGSAQVELTMAVSPPGSGTTSPAAGGSYTYDLDAVVPISAGPVGGFEFNHWQVSAGDPPADPLSAATTVAMERDKTVTAVFIEPGSTAEFRGFWADAFHEGFKSTSQIDAMISRALAGNYNAIVPEVLAFQDTGGGGHGAYWNSSIVPKASDISGGIDPLAYLVQQAHAAGLEVHCWLVAFRVSSSWPPTGNPTLAAHPEWLMVPSGAMGSGPAKVSGYYTLDPGSPDAQEYLMSIVRELCENYAIDGIHWDYIRYTQKDAGYPSDASYPKSSLRRFQNITGYAGVPGTDYEPWNAFRRRTITEVVRRAMAEIPLAPNPRQPLRHTAALVTWYPAPPGGDFHQTRPYYDVFSDWEYWQYMGYLDATIPMSYFDENSYPNTYRSWVDNAVNWATAYNRHTFIGPGIYLNTFGDSVDQMAYAQSAGADGLNTYSYRSTNDGGQPWNDWYPYVAANLFTHAAVPPSMPWRDPAQATEGMVYGRVTDYATGEPIDDATVAIPGVEWVRTDGNGFYLLTRVPAAPGGSTHDVSASYPGFDARTLPVVAAPAGIDERDIVLGGCVADSSCDDSVFCNGEETCAESGDCLPGLTPCDAGQWCDEASDQCVTFGDGDFNADGNIDLSDFGGMQACMYSYATEVGCAPGNLTGSDGWIDDADYALFAAGLTGP